MAEEEEKKPKKALGARPDRVRLVVLLYRKKGLSVEDFQTSWYVLRSRFFLVCTGLCASRYVLSNIVLVLPGPVFRLLLVSL